MKASSRRRIGDLLGGSTPAEVQIAPIPYIGTVVFDDACAFVLENVVDDAPMLAAGRYRYLKGRGFEPADVSDDAATAARRLAAGLVDGWAAPIWRGERAEVDVRIGRETGRYRSDAGQEIAARRYRTGRGIGYLDAARAGAFLQVAADVRADDERATAKPVRFAVDGRTVGMLMPLRDDGSFERGEA